MDFGRMMSLDSHGTDVYVATGPRYPWGGLYGGQIVSQGIRAAAATVEPTFRPHSVHAYFIRRGDHAEPIRFEVDRVRNGRSFVTRRVVARQSVGAILASMVSFQVDEKGPEVQTVRLPDVAGPEQLEGDSWSPMFDRRTVPVTDQPGRAAAWLRLTDGVGTDSLLHACALAYMSDDLPTDAVASQHPDSPTSRLYHEVFMSASLDHSIWFHRPIEADGWQLHEFTCHGLLSSRGLAVGHVFTAEGLHVATVTQEVLVRRRD